VITHVLAATYPSKLHKTLSFEPPSYGVLLMLHTMLGPKITCAATTPERALLQASTSQRVSANNVPMKGEPQARSSTARASSIHMR
jgi:hypothetical protein